MALTSSTPTILPPAAGEDLDLAAADAAAEKMLAESRSKNGNFRVDVSPDRENDLDAAFAAVNGTDPKTGEVAERELGLENGGVKRRLEGSPEPKQETEAEKTAREFEEEKAAAEKAAGTAPAPAPTTPTPPPAAPDGKPARKGLLGEVLEEKTPAGTEADDPKRAYDDLKLRSDASEKTKESFEHQRARAIERETAVRTQLEERNRKLVELEAQITELSQKVGALTPETESELKELREFRALHDVSARPEFRERYDSRIEANNAAIHALLKSENMSDENIAKFKRLPEEARDVYLEKHVYPNLTPGQRRTIEGKLIANTSLAEERAQALAAARTDSDKILSEQKEAPRKLQQERNTAIANHLKPYLPQLPYLHTRVVPPTATAAEKTEIEAHNKLAVELQDNLRTAILDDSPQTRAESALAVVVARGLSNQIKAIAAERDSLKARLAAIDKASATGGRLGRSAAPVQTNAPAKPASVADDSGDVIDRLFNENQRP
jgi:hypothetical protein